MMMKTKILSILKLHSIKYALMNSTAVCLPFSYHIKIKKAKAKQTQSMVCSNAVLVLMVVFFLLRKPKSRNKAITITMKKTRYVI